MVFLLLACAPRAPLGALDEAVLPSLWTGLGPDSLTWLYFTARTVWAPNDQGEWCPTRQGSEDGAALITGGCSDDWGNSWQGEMLVSNELAYADFQDFGVVYDPVAQLGVTHDWSFDGEVSWVVDPDEGYVVFHVDGDLELTTSGAEYPVDVLAAISAEARLTRQVDEMTVGSGELTLEDWGRVEFTVDGAKLDGISGCENGADGVIEVIGANQAAIWLPEGSACLEDTWACPDLELGGERQPWCRTENELGWNAAL